MPIRVDQDYFLARAAEEMRFGETSPNQRVAAIHFELAYRYAVMAHESKLRLVRDDQPRSTFARLRHRPDIAQESKRHLSVVDAHA